MGVAMLAGCSGVTGAAVPNVAQALAYEAEVTASSAAASSSKAAADAADTAFSICEQAVARSKDDVIAFNAYIDAGNDGDPAAGEKGHRAAASAAETAAWLETVSSDLPPTLSELFDNLASSLRSSVPVIERPHTPTEINSITATNNSIRDALFDECGSL